MTIEAAMAVLFKPDDPRDRFCYPQGYYDMNQPYSNQELLRRLLEIRRRCNIQEIDVIQQVARKIGWDMP